MNRALASGPIVWLGIIVTTCLLLALFQTVLWLVMPLLISVVSYYVLSPLVHMAMARGLTRARAVLIITVMLTIFIAALGIIVYPKIARAANNWPAKVGDYVESGARLVVAAQNTVSKMTPFMRRSPAPPDVAADKTGATGAKKEKASLTGKLESKTGIGDNKVPSVDDGKPSDTDTNALDDKVAAWIDKNSSDFAVELLHWIPSVLLIPYMTYFFLLDGPRFKRFLVQAIPNAFFEKTLFLFYRVEEQLRRYFQGLMALTALDAMCLGIGLWIFGLNAPFILAILAAVMAWLPYLGSIAGGLLVVLVAAHDFPGNPWLPYEVVGLFIGVRLLDDFVFMPLTVGRSLSMHPLVTVLMILLGGAVAGIAGLLLVMPVLGVVMVAGQIIGELLTDPRILARHRHAKEIRHRRARADLHWDI
jgi:predicted PurR-regulated permease PerM